MICGYLFVKGLIKFSILLLSLGETCYNDFCQVRGLNMASIIRVLEDVTINQIAAGEVVENPASVVKELVENALDAKADSITIEVKSGGFQLIKVIDNGTGMSQDDSILAIERHATSKIKHIDDLLNVSSMGFRGEALASIASISKLQLTTALDHDKQLGCVVLCEGGKIKFSQACSRPRGTTIEVRSLFYNVPARKKFQKSAAMSLAEITKTINVLALSRPDVDIKFYADNKLLLSVQKIKDSSNKEEFKKRVEDILGKELTRDMKYTSSVHERWQLNGFLGSAQMTKSNRLGQFLFINFRSVVSLDISYAVSDGYASAIPERRFPVFILYLTVPPSDIDVNVHPQKKEVKFKETSSIKAFIRKAVGRTLDQSQNFTSFPQEISIENSFSSFQESFKKDALNLYRQNFKEFKLPENPKDVLPPNIIKDDSPNKTSRYLLEIDLEKAYLGIYKYFAFFYAEPLREHLKHINLSDDGLVVVHLKAMQKKMHFERAFQAFDNSGLTIEKEALLFPEKMQLTAVEAENLMMRLSDLLKLGIEIRPFGINSFVIESLSPLYDIKQVKDFIFDIVRGESFSISDISFEMKKKLAQKIASLALSGSYTKSGSLAMMSQFIANNRTDCFFQGESVFTIINELDMLKIFRK